MNTTGSRRTLAAVGMTVVAIAATVVPAAASLRAPAPSPAPMSALGAPGVSGSALVAACRGSLETVPFVGHGTCRNAEQLLRDAAQLCRFARSSAGTPDLPPEATCSSLDGRVYSEAAMAEYEASWVHRALALQNHLDDHVPLRLALFPATHNSFNSADEPPTLSGLDHNQVASLTDQLRLDMRSLELDVHWSQSAHGDPAAGMRAPVLCHAQAVGVGVTSVHAGCSTERHLRDGLGEIRAWLDANPSEFLLLYLENGLDSDPVAHAAAAGAIADTLGALVFRPTSACAPMPTALSKSQILAGGARVLIVGNCGPGAWGGWVHDRGIGTVWDEDKSGDGDDFACPVTGYSSHFQRFYEDSTWLSDTVEPTGQGSSGQITEADTRAMVACGVNLFGFDQLVPADPRLEALVWSWAVGEPSTGTAAWRAADGRFRSGDAGDARPYACRLPAGTWAVTAAAGPWGAGQSSCDAEFPGSDFSVPATGADNTVPGSAWLDYALVGGAWAPETQ